jgi:hypothetical protein
MITYKVACTAAATSGYSGSKDIQIRRYSGSKRKNYLVLYG